MLSALLHPAYGAVGDGIADDTLAIQGAINDAITTRGTVRLPPGVFRFSTLDLTGISTVSNSAGFGLRLEGEGMGTTLLHDGIGAGIVADTGAAGADIQLEMEGFQLRSAVPALSSTVPALTLGRLNRYSRFRDLRIYGFRSGIRFNRNAQGIEFYGIDIRGCAQQAVIVDTANVTSITEMRWFGGYWDNNNTASANGGTQYHALDIQNARDWHFFGTVMEGNNGGGIQIRSGCRNISFQIRSEETNVHGSVARNIHSIAPDAKLIVFRNTEFAWTRSTIGHCWGVLNGQVKFDSCRFFEVSRAGANSFNGLASLDLKVVDCVFESGTVQNAAATYSR